jgi:hypothetical protein
MGNHRMQKSRNREKIVESLELESPRVAMESLGIFQDAPMLSFEDDMDEAGDADDLSPKRMSLWIKEFQRRFASIKSKWGKTFSDVEASHIVVVKDLQKLQHAASEVITALGKPTVNGVFPQGTSVWRGLSSVADSLSDQTITISAVSDSVEVLQKAHSDLHQTFIESGEEHESSQCTVTKRLHFLERCSQTFEQRFSKILPMLIGLKNGGHPSQTNNELVAVQNQLQELAAKVETLQNMLWNAELPTRVPLQGAAGTMEEPLLDIRGQLKTLQQRVVGGGVQIGAKVFQSFEDVETWVKTELPTQRYGLFVDAVSLLDFFSCIGHVDADKTFAAFHSQQKTGFSSMYEARVAASVQNLFPIVFGKSSSAGLDDSEYIPAIQDPDRWDNGVTGLKHQICRGMSDVEYQLKTAIKSILNHYPEAKQIAKECLYKAKRFVSDLCNFISNDYQKWKFRGHGKKEAWRMMAVSFRRVFEEIHSEWVVARDIYDYKDSTFSTAKFLWATWKAHMVMERYIKHQFYEHPAIAAVLARHLADNYVKPDDALSNKLSTLDKAHKALVTRFDTFLTRDKENRQKKREGPRPTGCELTPFATSPGSLTCLGGNTILRGRRLSQSAKLSRPCVILVGASGGWPAWLFICHAMNLDCREIYFHAPLDTWGAHARRAFPTISWLPLTSASLTHHQFSSNPNWLCFILPGERDPMPLLPHSWLFSRKILLAGTSRYLTNRIDLSHLEAGGVMEGHWTFSSNQPFRSLATSLFPLGGRCLRHILNKAASIPPQAVVPAPRSDDIEPARSGEVGAILHWNAPIPQGQIESMVWCPSVFVTTGWVHRYLMLSEKMLAFDIPSAACPAGEGQAEDITTVRTALGPSSRSSTLPFISAPPLKLLQRAIDCWVEGE